MQPEDDILLRAQRLLAESAELGRQCAEFYERQAAAEPRPGKSFRTVVSTDPQEPTSQLEMQTYR